MTMVVKIGDIIYNIPLKVQVYSQYSEGAESMNFYNKKSRKIMSSIIIIILVLAMVIPTLAYLIQ